MEEARDPSIEGARSHSVLIHRAMRRTLVSRSIDAEPPNSDAVEVNQRRH
jgi:hypothetical protein